MQQAVNGYRSICPKETFGEDNLTEGPHDYCARPDIQDLRPDKWCQLNNTSATMMVE